MMKATPPRVGPPTLGDSSRRGPVASLLTKDPEAAIIILYRAGIAQVVEHLLPKQRVAGSNPVSRSSLNVASRKVSVACPGAAG